MDAGLDPGDQIELPAEPLNLPGAERDERREDQKAGEHDSGTARPGWARRDIEARPAFRRHGMLLICSCDIGIMFVLRWYMTQSEPARVMTTITTVKISASMFQPCSDLVFMCRK